ncbi:MAG: hypothetical protein A3I07_01720 [Candidatus Doudnabacteria bacterium RIFCSPLOWO2_02_FULL_42_9]|uniref:Uncharacterized protein n=1 Tax=Candidatus Doudnabacteria bacterium RIFCSPHIGHO2_01_FULL_41_86 TaxID=1817821 RepID=A0A1F5N7R2_9BACT|nr:MAG: hypothetical protein A2717_03585 [Candidatus Doudnabacteria bacterium RIFCSPHIGHO2_01_FULL_41_86]OGE74756.1 MAG: hypothetical protein A3K07_03180 [Candidatus Doudnabacteria bacterium RIFCSPHIGHO2_01_43_10]OGE85723.1 MAG: hypothetical protein A3E28_02915 [Candidatus Doudnabacteria bacterium RIFCSPHIGHO2_12_FULL_42_22]OGE87219.1 MAG: hypothetical protein A3C49_00545 [Candidatus Doudnabacteria bacterium RIFCSPHIGHO2_02_FULL_42_25]OGE92056.1 MAG: hypothetical protein A2895_00420 [Candidatus
MFFGNSGQIISMSHHLTLPAQFRPQRREVFFWWRMRVLLLWGIIALSLAGIWWFGLTGLEPAFVFTAAFMYSLIDWRISKVVVLQQADHRLERYNRMLKLLGNWSPAGYVDARQTVDYPTDPCKSAESLLYELAAVRRNLEKEWVQTPYEERTEAHDHNLWRSRERLKEAYDLFLEFGLIKPTGYQKYFDKPAA